ncbi:MAG: OmpA family protein [Bacteroidales bacterium]|nr:OmpA family protein [Bacteroidales bacterium]
MKIKNILIVILFCLFSLNGFTQKDLSLKANNAFNSGQYFKAIDLYKYAYAKTKDNAQKAEVMYKTALCYRLTNNSRQAEIWFRKAIKKKYSNPIAILFYADAKKINKKYDEAIVEYENYKKLVPGDPRGEKGISSCKLAKEWIENPTRYEIINMYFFNSKQSDFCPAYAKDDYSVVYFTSSREGATGNSINDVTGEYYSDIFQTRKDRKGKWKEPVPLDKSINSEFDEGTPSLNKKTNTIYFTSFRENKEEKLGCQIYVAKKQGIGWSEAQIIPLVADTITVGHPSISDDELTLYFAANMKGGKGGKDIWKITRSNKSESWEQPVNLGTDINTSDNEMFPFIHQDGTLYFSSNGHPGMGGLDIFMAVEKEEGKWTVENMKYPINSPVDDFGIIFEGDYERGYLSSSRKGSKGSDDIWQFSLPPIEFQLAGIVRNERTEEYIASASVNLIGSDGTNLTKTSENDGSFSFALKPNTDYRVVTKKGGFLNGKGKETTKGKTTSSDFRLDIFMSPNDSPKLVNIFYDLGKWDLRPESLIALEELVEILNDNPNITIELGSHTDFRSGAEYNRDLSEKRAKSVVDFLITYGIDEERLSSKGYGESNPTTVTKQAARQYNFLTEGDVMTESFINRMPTNDMKEICHELNRRTEFIVTGTDYIPKIRRKR